MANRHRLSTWSLIAALGSSSLGLLVGCASEPNAVLNVGARNLRCSRGELETALHRESPRVAEYYVGCDFMYTRVLCDKPSPGHPARECHPAKPQPPCFAGGCFKENPTTFEWELDETLASAEPQPKAEDLFATPRP
jgi:hypothetical protein